MKNIEKKIKKCLKLNLILFFCIRSVYFFIVNGILLKNLRIKAGEIELVKEKLKKNNK